MPRWKQEAFKLGRQEPEGQKVKQTKGSDFSVRRSLCEVRGRIRVEIYIKQF